MLRQLSIENVAVIEKADIEFGGGFNVLTGETGAGKSILIDSINAILGNRTSREIVRSGSEKSSIWAQFDNVEGRAAQLLEENGYGCDGTLLVYREITADGKSICRINNRPATAASVREVCSLLVNIHGQHDSQALLSPDQHIYILDSFAELDDERRGYQKVFSRLVEVKKEIDSLNESDKRKESELELLNYQVNEIEKAELREGEEEELNERRKLIKNSERIAQALSAACAALSGNDNGDDPGAVSRVYDASSELSAAAEYSTDIKNLSDRLTELYYGLEENASDIQSLLDGFDFDASEVEQIEERLDLLYHLKQKYGQSIEEILKFQSDAQQRIDSIETSAQRLEQLNNEFSGLLKEAQVKADELTKRRLEAFEVFSGRIRAELDFLNMPGISFTLNCEKGPLGRNGQESLEFYISTNPGEPPKPLARIASGGELSRIMLAIKNALADKDDMPTLIFDEIDTGISGSSAQKVAQKLKQAASTRQIICVTHSAPIAAYSDIHMLIEKNVRDGRTYTTVNRLDSEGETRQLARMISGDNVTEISLKNAQEMLALAKGNN